MNAETAQAVQGQVAANGWAPSPEQSAAITAQLAPAVAQAASKTHDAAGKPAA